MAEAPMTTPERNLRLFGTRIPNVADKRRLEEYQRAQDVAYMQQQSGARPQMDGLSLTGTPESTLGMSPTEKFFSQGRALDLKQRGGYQTFGDKSRGEAINAVRQLQGLPPIANTPDEFEDLLNQSLAAKDSALLTPEGRRRAISAGIKAGLPAADATVRVMQAYRTASAIGEAAGGAAAGTPAAGTSVTSFRDRREGAEEGGVGAGDRGAAAPSPTPAASELMSEDVRQSYSEALGSFDGDIPQMIAALRGGAVGGKGFGAGGRGLAQIYSDAVAAAKKGLTAAEKAKNPLATVKAAERLTRLTKLAPIFGRLEKITGSKPVKGLSLLGNIARIAEPAVAGYGYATEPDSLDPIVDKYIQDVEGGRFLKSVGEAIRDITPVGAQAFNPNYDPVGEIAARAVAPLEISNRAALERGEMEAQAARQAMEAPKMRERLAAIEAAKRQSGINSQQWASMSMLDKDAFIQQVESSLDSQLVAKGMAPYWANRRRRQAAEVAARRSAQ